MYVTTDDIEQARTIARSIVEQRLAACANIIPSMESVYWWDGEMQSASECIVIFKTRRALIDALTDAVKAIHTYETPCIVALPIIAGSPAYLQWVADETIGG